SSRGAGRTGCRAPRRSRLLCGCARRRGKAPFAGPGRDRSGRMRIVRLNLLAFGSFSAAGLQFGRKPSAIELVYGSNEAGKSTTLRAISGLLFGIPERTRDAHRHLPSELRVGAVLEGADGRRLEVVRRKGRKGTLRDQEDHPI